MHNIFDKSLFFNKRAIFIPECDSTNDEIMRLIKQNKAFEGLVVHTDHQNKGKGQRGNIWLDEPKKNALLSILLYPTFITSSQHHFLNIIVGLAVSDALACYLPKEIVSLKWPNDLFVHNKKMGGILIENNLQGEKILSSIIGIGINVNQQGFNNSSFTSVFLTLGKKVDLMEFKEKILIHLEKWYLEMKSEKFHEILEHYYRQLLWKDEEHFFKSGEQQFSGIIQGIDEYGRLIVICDGKKKMFSVKEISFLY